MEEEENVEKMRQEEEEEKEEEEKMNDQEDNVKLDRKRRLNTSILRRLLKCIFIFSILLKAPSLNNFKFQTENRFLRNTLLTLRF